MIAITGASGNLGKTLIPFLLEKTQQENIVAIVRNPNKLGDLLHSGIQVRVADYNDKDSLIAAFNGIDKVLQISTNGVNLETAKQQEINVVEAIVINKIKHIVYISTVQASDETLFQGTAGQFFTENLIKSTKIPYTIFRDSMYLDVIPDLIGDALTSGEIRYPGGNGSISYVSRRDIAQALSNVLLSNEHKNKTYEITGKKAYSFNDLAKILGNLTNTKLAYVDCPQEELRNLYE
jgi:NAD(P)H dehydrogenase (quinone)